jgi:hypothetical protein
MRILFTFVTDWQKEVADYERGLVPTHRLFGFADLREMGHAPRLCPTPRRLGKYAKKGIVWRICQALYAVRHQRNPGVEVKDYVLAVGTTDARDFPTLLAAPPAGQRLIIFTDVPRISEYFEDGVSALGVKLHDAADFGEKLRAVLETPERFAEIRWRAPEWVEPFTSRHFAEHLLEIAGRIVRK